MRSRHPIRSVVRPSVLALAALLALGACDDTPTVPRSSAWTGERLLTTAAGTRIRARLDRGPAAPTWPTVVLVSGLDTPLEVWEGVRTGLAASAPVFSYDRGGVGESGAVTGARPSSVVAEELRATLAAAGVRPPYVLVAHSIGGLHARVFAHRHPQDVVGVVLVDATPEAVLAMMEPADVEEVAAQMRYAGARAEVRAQPTSVAQVAASRLPDVPLSVITSMKPEPGEGPGVREWLAQLQGEWLRQVRRAEQVRTDAGHMVPLEAPAVIVDATRRVLAGAVR